MPDGYAFKTKADVARVVEATRLIERFPPGPAQRSHPLPQSRQRWHPATNSSGADITARSLVDFTAATEEASPVYTIEKPGTTFRRYWAVVGPDDIPDGGTGRITFDPVCRVVRSGTAPDVGDIGGPKGNDTTYARYRGSNYGFTVMSDLEEFADDEIIARQHTVNRVKVKTPSGGIDSGSNATCDVYSLLDADINFNLTVENFGDADVPGDTIIEAAALGEEWVAVGGMSGVIAYFGKTTGALNKGASGTINIWTGTAGSETVTSSPLETIAAYNHFANLESGKKVILLDGLYGISGAILIAGEC